jgi:hypothetical protein
MRPRQSFFGRNPPMPDWVREFRNQLAPTAGDDSSPARLSPVQALEEVLAVAESVRAGAGVPNRENCESLRRDAAASMDEVGSHIRVALQQALTRFRTTDLPQMPKDLGAAASAGKLAGGVRVLRNEFTSDPAVQAAWDDVLDDVQNDRPTRDREWKFLILRDICIARDWRWAELVRVLRGVIGDEPFSLFTAGHGDPPSSASLAASEESGLSVDDRLALCRTYLVSEPPRGRIVVWMGFTEARIDGHVIDLGPVAFYAGYLFDNRGLAPVPAWDEIGKRAELSDGDFMGFGEPREHTVFARVDIGEAALHRAEEWAIELVETTIYHAHVGSSWRRLNGTSIYREGHGWSGALAGFVDPVQTEARLRQGRRQWEPTGRALSGVAPSLLTAFANREPEAVRAGDEIRWYRNVLQLQDAALRVAFSARALERLLPVSEGFDWVEAAKRYLRADWILNQLWNELLEAALLATHSRLDAGPDPDPAFRPEFKAAVLPPADGGAYLPRLHEAPARLDGLAALWPGFSSERAFVRDVAARTADGAALAKWIGELKRDFDTLSLRAARQRNAVVHGTPTVPQVVDSVDPFSQQLGRIAVGSSVQAVLKRTDLLELLDTRGLRFEKIEARLKDGGSVRDLLEELFAIE